MFFFWGLMILILFLTLCITSSHYYFPFICSFKKIHDNSNNTAVCNIKHYEKLKYKEKLSHYTLPNSTLKLLPLHSAKFYSPKVSPLNSGFSILLTQTLSMYTQSYIGIHFYVNEIKLYTYFCHQLFKKSAVYCRCSTISWHKNWQHYMDRSWLI